MLAAPSIKKQFKVALYTSPLIAALAITPISILDRYSWDKYLPSFAFSTALVFSVWTVNIYLWRASQGPTMKRYLISSVINILLAGCVSLFMFHSSHFHFGGNHAVNFHFHMILFLSINFVILILQDLLLSREKNAAIELENQQLRLKNMEAVNQQLKQQIQPHFLFNSLSTLKSLMTVNPENAEEYLIRLSDFLRSSLSSHALNTLTLKDELHLCVNYLEMQKIRFEEALQFHVRVPDDIQSSYYLPVFSLQQLAENAIKHNIFTLDRPLSINISWQDGFVNVSNNLQKKEAPATGTGMGLNNLQERYKILSGNDIIIDQQHDTFSVSIKALEHASSHH